MYPGAPQTQLTRCSFISKMTVNEKQKAVFLSDFLVIIFAIFPPLSTSFPPTYPPRTPCLVDKDKKYFYEQ